MINEFSQKYAVIDLEATSPGPTASIIQVGIVIVEGKEIVDSYQTDINPHEPLSDHIKALTGITDQQLAQAPDFSQVARTIFELIEDCVFVAHNVTFDANLLAEALFLEGYDLLTPRVDTVELAQIFYPSLEKYSLSHLSEVLDLNLSDAHTAIADAQATANLFIKLLHKIESLPRECLETLLLYADSLLYETAMIVRQALAVSRPYSTSDYIKINQILLKKPDQLTKPYQLSQSFEINAALLGLEERPKQLSFAKIVEETLFQTEPAFIEAQAGIGKTYGYLLPLLAQKHQTQILVSVPTKLLQDQIMANEVRAIQEQFHIDCHSIKGPANYIKLDSFQESLNQLDDNRLVNRYKMQLLVWLLETRTGDLDEIKQKQRFAAYFDQIKHDGSIQQTSPFYAYDFWQQSYQRAKSARLLITNHAYFLHRIQDDKAFAKGKILVFDEAQALMLQLEELAHQRLNIAGTLQELQEQLAVPSSLLEQRLLEGIAFELNQLSSHYHQEEEKQQAQASQHLLRLQEHVKELGAAASQSLKQLFQQQEMDYWVSSEQQADKRQTFLNGSSRTVLQFKALLPEVFKAYFVSATLQISPSISLADLLGFDTYSYHQLAKEKSTQQLVVIDQDMPLIKDLTDEAYTQTIAARLLVLHQQQQVPILVLFNAKKHMLMVSDYLEANQVQHLTQGKNGTAYHIKKRFDRGEQSMLLGLAAFWEGVDFVHADRMIEVITRLPFDNPEDIATQKMQRYLQAAGKQPFNDYFLPMTILRLKQAIGRTLRRKEQKSAVLILDRRILTMSYGQTILHSLEEEFLISQQNFHDSLAEIGDFLI